MADVDTTPQQPEPLQQTDGGDKVDAADDAAENSQTDVVADDANTDSARDVTGPSRDSPEGKKEGGKDGDAVEAKRPSPEGAQGDDPATGTATTTNDNATSGEATAEPQATSGDEPATRLSPSGSGESEAASRDDSKMTEKKEKEEEAPGAENSTAEGQLNRQETAKDSEDVHEERKKADEAEKRSKEDEGAEGTDTARDEDVATTITTTTTTYARQPPSTPTFDSDGERGDDTNRGTDDGRAADADGVTTQGAGGNSDTGRGKATESLDDEDARAEAEERADGAPAVGSVSSPTGGIAVNKRLTNTPLEGAAPALKPATAQLPPVARGRVRGQQMTSAITDALQHGPRPSPKPLIRSRRPPKYIRLATVTVSPAKARPLPQGPSLYYEEPKRPKKVITWDEATNARPPLRIDMEGPTACSYTPRVKPLNETNAPSFTFGSKCFPEKSGGARTSWSKTWFQTPHVWHTKVDFSRDALWPSPNHYPKGPGIGPRQRTMPEAPSFTFGHKPAYSIARPEATKEPSPNEYKRQNADKIVLPRGPSFTHQLRREGTMLWGAREITPGPAAYSPNKPSPERPSFTIQGIRREKSHILGPYSSL